MKKHLSIITTTILCLGLTPALGQSGKAPGGPKFDGAMAKLFGVHSTFSAAMEFQSVQASGVTNTVPGKICFDAGKSRFEMNLSETKGMKMPASAMAQMKAMGMDSLISITRPDQKFVYLIYPGLRSYVEMPPTDPMASTNSEDYKIESTELGRETVDGHNCVNNKVVVTDKDNATHEYTVWNATDLRNFPVKIVTADTGQLATMLFKQITFARPAASEFEIPADFTKYDNIQAMMQTEMMKKMGGGTGFPPGR